MCFELSMLNVPMLNVFIALVMPSVFVAPIKQGYSEQICMEVL